jgi:adenosylcobinamide-GDP ribazoletransferase
MPTSTTPPGTTERIADARGVPPSGARGARAQLRACAAAFTFLTRIPAGALVAHDVSDLPAAATYFPIVGFVVGGAGAIGFWLFTKLWSPTIAIVLSVAFTVWLTGAFHEDALADALDGFGGGWDRAQVLAIMKDSRIGSYALVGVFLVIAAKLTALRSIFDAAPAHRGIVSGGAIAVGRALIAAHVLGRWSSVALIADHQYVRAPTANEREGAGRPFVGAVTRARLAIATVVALLITVVALGRATLGAAIVAGIVVWLAGRYFERRIGGITGDALGAANQIVELAVYLTLAARW